MVISNDIKIGVDFEAYCDFYHKLKMYVSQLEHTFEEYKSDEYLLIRLNIYGDKIKIHEEYYFTKNSKLYKITNSSYIENGENKWTSAEEIETILMKTKFDHTINMDYFYKNN